MDVDLALGPAADSDGCVSRSADRLSPMDGAYIDCVMRWDPCGAVEDDDGDLSAADQMSVLDPWTFGWSVLGVELPKAKVVLLSLLLRSSIIRPSLSCALLSNASFLSRVAVSMAFLRSNTAVSLSASRERIS